MPASSSDDSEDLPPPAAATSFSQLALSKAMHASLRAAAYDHPTPIQAALIPLALRGVDVLGQARTGTGKTAAFSIPILETIVPKGSKLGPQALVMVPTRELAVQVRDESIKLAKGRPFRIMAVYGGKPLRQQTEQLQKGADMVVGTPGRVLDLMGRGSLNLRELKVVVLDEADRMLDIGFRPDIEKILKACPESRQTLLLSATVPPPVQKLAQRYMRDPETVDMSPGDVGAETIEQFYFSVDGSRKYELLLRLLKREQPRQAIIFCRTKRGTQKVFQKLAERIRSVGCIHGDLPQSKRDRVMGQFRNKQLRLLVATDVIGRGIDVSSISHIINYDVPHFCDDYVHRVGRTGRMGREGVAYTFVTPEEGNELTRIEIRINKLLKRDHLPGFRATASPTTGPQGSGLHSSMGNAPKDSETELPARQESDTALNSPDVRQEEEGIHEGQETKNPHPTKAKTEGKKYRRAL